MASTSVHTDPVTPLTARKTWRTVEPLHGMIYFAPEAARSYAALGLPADHGYFASRAAPMGAVLADTQLGHLPAGTGARGQGGCRRPGPVPHAG
jgi:hypothetical protein